MVFFRLSRKVFASLDAPGIFDSGTYFEGYLNKDSRIFYTQTCLCGKIDDYPVIIAFILATGKGQTTKLSCNIVTVKFNHTYKERIAIELNWLRGYAPVADVKEVLFKFINDLQSKSTVKGSFEAVIADKYLSVCDMGKISLEEIKSKVEDLAVKINVPERMLPTFGKMKWDADPYITVDDSGYIHYIKSERGHESVHMKTKDLDDVLYTAFESVTFWMAADYEVLHRIEDQDSRRMLYAKQEELLGVLDEKWKERITKRHRDELLVTPFDDLRGLRATYWGKLRKEGYSRSECEKLAYEKYPKNK